MANWTSGFDSEFKKRNGYDCLDFLPAIAGYYVESGEITERFLWDFRKTIGSLMADNYYGYFREKCHKYGMKFSVEPYGGPFEAMRVGLTGDILMGEFWIGNKVYQNTLKLAVSAAHLNGQSVVGAESFTSMGGWLNHPATIKQLGDWVWSEGVNRFIFHTYTHQPWNVPPGVTFHMYGFEMSRLNTWWEQSRAYMDYIARSQYLLQSGKSFADVLIFAGESSPNDGIFRPDIKALGYDYDEICTNKITELTVENGLIRTPVGGKYRLLVLPETNWITPELLSKINELVKAGAVVVGVKPHRSPSLKGFPQCDDEVQRLVNELWDDNFSGKAQFKKGKVISNFSIPDVMKEIALLPDFSGGLTGGDLNFIHRIKDDTDIYFVANPKKESRKLNCSFRVTGKQPQLWNAQTGAIQDAAVWKEESNGTTSVELSLESEDAVFVVFEKKQSSITHLVQTNTFINTGKDKAPSDLQIIKAEYGTFLPDGLEDITDILNKQIKNGKLNITANNSLVSKDPASGVVKELRMIYEIGGQKHTVTVAENAAFVAEADKVGELKIIKGLYGKFPETMNTGLPKSDVHDVTRRVNNLIAANQLIITAGDDLPNNASLKNSTKKELRLVYTAEGETHNATIQQGGKIDLALKRPEPILEAKGNELIWTTPYSGKMNYVTSSGAKKTIVVPTVPSAIELKGKWDVSFPPNLGAPSKAVFDKLESWSLSSVEGIRYFSGTATYNKQFTVAKKLLSKNYSLELDLGTVKVIAEVFVNGKPLGILWKSPFRINLDGAVHAGANQLEVRITNLWPNRLIGDDRLPEDFDWGEWTIKSWPDWLVNKTSRSSKRVTFTTWKHWNKDSKLQASGLLGPVYIRPYRRIKIN